MDFAEIMNADGTGGNTSSGTSSANGGSTSGGGSAAADETHNENSNNFQNNALGRILEEEQKRDKEIAPEQTLSQDELATRKAKEVEQKYGIALSEEERANLKLAAISGANMDQSLQKITGINPAILALASEAAQGARDAGASKMQEHDPRSVTNGIALAQPLSTVVERSTEQQNSIA